ncbi:PIG-L deacetylase family protein [Marmoricola sp. URHB0036]|uniref:PIG-L deacetylase family protein n=1 Tax=Marmoricola sp. URHB0036 TaxID=1298863 RepID=UPI000408F3F8|nr:PIG-L family deacetylase [Marmoricola sp. URHB0036]
MTRTRQQFTLVSFHAHPDDEALLTGGLLARSAAEGHRVVLVTATAGERGLADDREREGLAALRMVELAASAEVLGCARVVALGYADSGLHPDPADPTSFVNQDVARCAEELAQLLRQERADVLTIYDANGGYGHPDHVQVHRVGLLAARLAETPVVLEATVPGRAFTSVLRALAFLGHPVGGSAPLGTDRVFSHPRVITHRVRVRGALLQKRAAMAAHGSQRRGGNERRAMDRFVRLPLPIFWLVFGREWYVEHGREAPDRLDDPFASLRSRQIRPWRTRAGLDS